MRLVRALAALALVLAAGCAAEDRPDAEVDVTGDLGTVPRLTFETPLPLVDASAETIVSGDGRIRDDGDVALLAISAFSGEDGAALDNVAAPSLVQLERADYPTELADQLIGAAEGSRILLVQPVRDGGADRMEITVIDVLPTRATGTEVPFGEGEIDLPEVGEDDDGAPTASVGEGVVEPDALRIVPLIKGGGPQILPDQIVFAQYTVWSWDDGAVFDSTWTEGAVPAVVDLDDVFPGVKDGILDQTVGSRILVLIPPELGIGTDSLVAIVDILAVKEKE